MSVPQLTFAEKVSIVYKLIMGDTVESIAAECERSIDEINLISEHHWSVVEVSHYLNNVNHWPIKVGLYPLMENVLFCWYVEQKNVTNKQLAEKAKEILDILNEQPRYTSQNVPTFTASAGWVYGFKARFNILPPKRKPTARETDTSKTVLSVRVGGEENSNSGNSVPKESENVSSDEEDMENEFAASNDEKMAKALKEDPKSVLSNKTEFEAQEISSFSDDQVNSTEPDINQWSTYFINNVADNANDNVNKCSAWQDIQDSDFSDMVAIDAHTVIDPTHKNLKTELAVSRDRGSDFLGNVDVNAGTAQVNQASPDFKDIAAEDKHARLDSTYFNLKIESVVSLAQQGDLVRNVEMSTDLRDCVADAGIDLAHQNNEIESVVLLSQKGGRSPYLNDKIAKVEENSNDSKLVGVDTPTVIAEVIAIIDLTENDDDVYDKTPNCEESSRGSTSTKRKRSLSLVQKNCLPGDRQRSLTHFGQFRHDSKRLRKNH